jgi:hypothetical protein
MAIRKTGRYLHIAVGGEEVNAFIPNPLPPKSPSLVINGKLLSRLQQAEQALMSSDREQSWRI